MSGNRQPARIQTVTARCGHKMDAFIPSGTTAKVVRASIAHAQSGLCAICTQQRSNPRGAEWWAGYSYACEFYDDGQAEHVSCSLCGVCACETELRGSIYHSIVCEADYWAHLRTLLALPMADVCTDADLSVIGEYSDLPVAVLEVCPECGYTNGMHNEGACSRWTDEPPAPPCYVCGAEAAPVDGATGYAACTYCNRPLCGEHLSWESGVAICPCHCCTGDYVAYCDLPSVALLIARCSHCGEWCARTLLSMFGGECAACNWDLVMGERTPPANCAECGAPLVYRLYHANSVLCDSCAAHVEKR